MKIRLLLVNGAFCWAACAFSDDFTVVNLADDMQLGSRPSSQRQHDKPWRPDLTVRSQMHIGAVQVWR